MARTQIETIDSAPRETTADVTFRLPEPRTRPNRLKLTIEIDSDLAVWFKTFCGKNGHQQRDIINEFLKSLRQRHGD